MRNSLTIWFQLLRTPGGWARGRARACELAQLQNQKHAICSKIKNYSFLLSRAGQLVSPGQYFFLFLHHEFVGSLRSCCAARFELALWAASCWGVSGIIMSKNFADLDDVKGIVYHDVAPRHTFRHSPFDCQRSSCGDDTCLSSLSVTIKKSACEEALRLLTI